MIKFNNDARASCFVPVEKAIADIAEGKFVIVVDETSRENEGDLIIAGEKMTVEKMTFLLKYTTGIICAALDSERVKQLDLPLWLKITVVATVRHLQFR